MSWPVAYLENGRAVDSCLHVTSILNRMVARVSPGTWHPCGSYTPRDNIEEKKKKSTLIILLNQIKQGWLKTTWKTLSHQRGKNDMLSKSCSSKWVFLASQDQNCQQNKQNSQLIEIIHIQYPVSKRGSTLPSQVAKGTGNQPLRRSTPVPTHQPRMSSFGETFLCNSYMFLANSMSTAT